MPAHHQPTTNKSVFPFADTATAPGSSTHDDIIASPRSLKSRENVLRNAVKKWFGPIETLDPAARAAEVNHHEVILQLLLRLHRLSCNLVPEANRLPLQEQEVFTAIVLLNRINVTLGSPHAAILCYCEARAVREKNIRASQIDPLQLRHLLTFHQDIPHEELNALDIQRLRTACEKAESTAIISWFETISKRRTVLPKDTPQFLRQLASDLWNAGHESFLETYAKELAVLDAALLHELGWENTRLFFALFKRLQGTNCRSAIAFLTEADIALAIEQSKQLGNSDETVHFRMLSTTYDAPAFRRLETTILAASREKGSRLRKSSDTTSPLERKKSVELPPVYGTPAFFARTSARQSH
ncbi:MAG: hypothetical protein QM715_07685 [Nibricoccus sp.]